MDAIIHTGGLSIALPHALTEPPLLGQLLPKLDGIYLPGSPSGVQPHLYGENGDESDTDLGCDLLDMAITNAALERHTPIFAICRGLQELVAVTDGSLYRKLCEQPKLLEYRGDLGLPVEQQYAPSYEVQVEEGGLLSALLLECSNFWVNSLRGQGAKVVSLRLCVEARSPDGLTGTVNVINHPFALDVQWHPERNSSEYAFSRILFEGFITACRRHIVEKQRLWPLQFKEIQIRVMRDQRQENACRKSASGRGFHNVVPPNSLG